MNGKRILFVDDEIYLKPYEATGNYMRYYLDALERAGYDVSAVNGPDQAIEAIKNAAPFDLILLDIMMPAGRIFAADDSSLGMRTGVLLAIEFASMSRSVPIVVLTNVNNPDVNEELRQIPSVQYILQKVDCPPFELVTRVEEVLGSTV